MIEKVCMICPNIGIVYSGMGPDYRVRTHYRPITLLMTGLRVGLGIKSTKECTRILEDLRRVPTDAYTRPGISYRDAAGDSIRVSDTFRRYKVHHTNV